MNKEKIELIKNVKKLINKNKMNSCHNPYTQKWHVHQWEFWSSWEIWNENEHLNYKIKQRLNNPKYHNDYLITITDCSSNKKIIFDRKLLTEIDEKWLIKLKYELEHNDIDYHNYKQYNKTDTEMRKNITKNIRNLLSKNNTNKYREIDLSRVYYYVWTFCGENKWYSFKITQAWEDLEPIDDYLVSVTNRYFWKKQILRKPLINGRIEDMSNIQLTELYKLLERKN